MHRHDLDDNFFEHGRRYVIGGGGTFAKTILRPFINLFLKYEILFGIIGWL